MDDKTNNLLILIANLAVLGFTLKLYTEYFKDRKADRRSNRVQSVSETHPGAI